MLGKNQSRYYVGVNKAAEISGVLRATIIARFNRGEYKRSFKIGQTYVIARKDLVNKNYKKPKYKYILAKDFAIRARMPEDIIITACEKGFFKEAINSAAGWWLAVDEIRDYKKPKLYAKYKNA